MSFRFDKLTIKAQEAVARAQELAGEKGNPQIEPMHLLSALLAEDGGIVRPVLEKVGANVAQLEQIVDAELKHLPKSSGGAPPNLSQALSKVLDAAQAEADKMKDAYVSSEHVLMGLAANKAYLGDLFRRSPTARNARRVAMALGAAQRCDASRRVGLVHRSLSARSEAQLWSRLARQQERRARTSDLLEKLGQPADQTQRAHLCRRAAIARPNARPAGWPRRHNRAERLEGAGCAGRRAP